MSNGLHTMGQHFPKSLRMGRTMAKSCKGKQNHADPIKALMSAHFMYVVKRESVWAYKCSFCCQYHVGHQPFNVRLLISQLLNAPPPPVMRRAWTDEESERMNRLWGKPAPHLSTEEVAQ
jgi:hypothetical protein